MLTNSVAALIDCYSTSSVFDFLLNSKQTNVDFLNVGAGMFLGSCFLLKGDVSLMTFLISCKKRFLHSAKLKVKTFDSEFNLKLGSWKADIHVTKNK